LTESLKEFNYLKQSDFGVINKEEEGLFILGGCQSSNFDAQIADTTISMISCLLRSFRFRYEHSESKGDLYRTM